MNNSEHYLCSAIIQNGHIINEYCNVINLVLPLNDIDAIFILFTLSMCVTLSFHCRRVPLLPQVLPSRQLPTPGTSELGIVTHVDSPTKFHIHLSSCLTKLRQMESLFDNLPPPPPSYMPIPLDHCLALFPADHRYHRARIESVAEGKVGVFFVDYGNRLDIDVGGVVPMLGACLVLPEMALPCLLDGFGVEEEVVGRGEGVVCWSYEHCMEFCQLVLEKEVMVTIKVRRERRKGGRGKK